MAKFLVFLYLGGLALIRWGVVGAAANYGDTHSWNLRPDRDVLGQLFNAAITLVRPFLAWVIILVGLIKAWPIPMLLVIAVIIALTLGIARLRKKHKPQVPERFSRFSPGSRRRRPISRS